VLENQFNSLIGSEEMHQVIIWGLSEQLPVFKGLDLKGENIGDQLLSEVFGGTFDHTDKNFSSMYPILMRRVYYLALHIKIQENPFCGIDLQQSSGQEDIKKALKHFINLAYA
jgi:hypothetical protein